MQGSGGVGSESLARFRGRTVGSSEGRGQTGGITMKGDIPPEGPALGSRRWATPQRLDRTRALLPRVALPETTQPPDAPPPRVPHPLVSQWLSSGGQPYPIRSAHEGWMEPGQKLPLRQKVVV